MPARSANPGTFSPLFREMNVAVPGQFDVASLLDEATNPSRQMRLALSKKLPRRAADAATFLLARTLGKMNEPGARAEALICPSELNTVCVSALRLYQASPPTFESVADTCFVEGAAFFEASGSSTPMSFLEVIAFFESVILKQRNGEAADIWLAFHTFLTVLKAVVRYVVHRRRLFVEFRSSGSVISLSCRSRLAGLDNFLRTALENFRALRAETMDDDAVGEDNVRDVVARLLVGRCFDGQATPVVEREFADVVAACNGMLSAENKKDEERLDVAYVPPEREACVVDPETLWRRLELKQKGAVNRHVYDCLRYAASYAARNVVRRQNLGAVLANTRAVK